MYSQLINPPVPQPINSPFRRLLSGCIMAIDTDSRSTVKLLDRTGLSAGASISGAVPVLGLYGNHYRFDGVDDKATVSGDRIGTGDITFECWCRPTGWGGLNAGRLVDNGKCVLYLDNSGRVQLSSDGIVTSAISALGSIVLNAWHHVVVARKSDGKATFYINGSRSGTADQNSGTPASGTTDTVLGNRAAGDRAFAGDYAYPNVYNRIFTQQEILALYRADCWRYGLRG